MSFLSSIFQRPKAQQAPHESENPAVIFIDDKKRITIQYVHPKTSIPSNTDTSQLAFVSETNDKITLFVDEKWKPTLNNSKIQYFKQDSSSKINNPIKLQFCEGIDILAKVAEFYKKHSQK